MRTLDQAAKPHRLTALHSFSSALRAKLAGQNRSHRIIEVSAAGTALAVGVFWAALLLVPQITEAEAEAVAPLGMNPEQLTLSAGRDLGSFDDRFQRYMGVLDILDGRESRPAN